MPIKAAYGRLPWEVPVLPFGTRKPSALAQGNLPKVFMTARWRIVTDSDWSSRPARSGDVELAATIRSLVDERPTYGYRRIAPLATSW